MRHLALSAVGRDRPGIVAGVTAVLVRHGVNLEDSRMANLRGEFAMVLVLGAPVGLERAALEEELGRVREELGLKALTLADLSETGEDSPAGAVATHVVSVYGSDHPGIVHAVAAALARDGANITDVTTRLVEEPGGLALYAMALEVAVTGAADERELERALAEVGRAQSVEVSFRALERDPL